VEMRINKLDLLTIAVLSTVFFSIATLNLGMTKTPLTTWQADEDTSFYIDLGEIEEVQRAYLLVKFGSANVTVYRGSPDDWIPIQLIEIPTYGTFSYYRWTEFRINSGTRYLRFEFTFKSIETKEVFLEVAEVGVLNSDNQKVVINVVTGEETSDPNLSKVIDEQDIVVCPPTYMSEAYFDEKYFVRTAEDYVESRYPYEWTHPPLGKLILAGGISVFGFNPFGWRITGVVFATLMLPLIYFVGKILFGTWIGAFASAFLLTFDFMNFAMGRMATIDVYVAFFSLASQLFFLIYIKNVLKNGWKTSVLPLFLAVLFFAFGVSTKWIVLFGFLGQLSILLAFRFTEVIKLSDGLFEKVKAFLDRPFFRLYVFSLFAIIIYFLTYIPRMLSGKSLLYVFNLQGAMFSYHSMLVSTHPFASQWWSWPLILRPVLLSITHLPNDVVSVIVAMGNPAVWWVGFVSLIVVVGFAIRKRGLAPLFIVVLFLFQWLPYVLISRITYLYHFYVSVPFLCLASAFFVNKYWSNKWWKAVILIYFSIVGILFWLFYPVISGIPVPAVWNETIRWFESWGFY
jgi:dolichyl-phosphate-mannose-protein mannosyltransferase